MQRPDAAIFFGKQAVNTLQALRTQLAPADRAWSAFVTRVAYVYAALADWLRDAGRLPEAQEVLDLLGEDDYFQYVRPDPGAARMAAFSEAESRAAERYRMAGAGLARLAAEREALRVLATRGSDQDTRLAPLNQQWTTAQQAFERAVQDIHATLTAPAPRQGPHIHSPRPLAGEELGMRASMIDSYHAL